MEFIEMLLVNLFYFTPQPSEALFAGKIKSCITHFQSQRKTMPAPTIEVNHLSKHYKVPTREEGLKAATKSLFKRTYKTVKAVDDISFSIAPGEVVGFLGPNGAGKTTTLKMLSGLLFPTDGTTRVLGYEPSKRQPDFLRQITMVMGNRRQLAWDLPALDSFELQRAVYGVQKEAFKKTRDEFIELLEIKELVKKPVRNLSLGERMKMEFVGALLHRPQILFLDEPTIGLDVTMQRRIRTFVAEYNQRYGATVLLTSHYMADVEALCKRLIVIHNGKLLFDGDLSELMDRFSALKTISVTLNTAVVDLRQYGEVLSQDGLNVKLRVPKSATPQVTARILAEQRVEDLSVENPPIEDVIEKIFDLKSAEGDAA
jgi:ABC-2 type transport system ATP-binding protein